MTIRTLKRDDSLHIANIWSIVLAFAGTVYYYDSVSVYGAGSQIGDFLLTPLYLTDYIFLNFFQFSITGNVTGIFLTLWFSFFAVSGPVSQLLIIKDHQPSELKSWYRKKFNA